MKKEVVVFFGLSDGRIGIEICGWDESFGCWRGRSSIVIYFTFLWLVDPSEVCADGDLV